jgi:hypothetical protein
MCIRAGSFFFYVVLGGRFPSAFLGRAFPGPRLTLVPILFSVLYWLLVLAITLLWPLDQLRCRRWRRSGAFTTTEGTVSNYRSEGGGIVTFQLADQRFSVKKKTWRGGFRITGVPAVPDNTEFIEDWAHLRVMHRSGRILRIETLAAPGRTGSKASPASSTTAQPHCGTPST